MNDLTPWQKALDRLVMAPVLSPPQARFLIDNLGVPRSKVLAVLLDALGSPEATRADGAAFLLKCALRGDDRPAVAAFVSGTAPVAVRARVRTLFQAGLLSGRLSETEADLPAPAGEAVAFHVEDVVREARGIASPWQRARVAGESLVSDPPLPDDAAPAAVAALAQRLDIDAARVWAELLVHPLSRAAFRSAARDALAAPSSSAATHLELAAPQLLPGPHHDTATAEARRHREGTATTAWTARLSGADAAARFACVLSTDSPEPMALAGIFPPEAGRTDVWFARGADAENVLALGARLEAARGPLVTVPAGVALQRTALHALAEAAPSKGKKGKPSGAAVPGLAGFLRQAGLAAPAEAPALADVAGGPVDSSVADHGLFRNVALLTDDIPEDARKALAKELKRGTPREESVQALARDVAAKRGTVMRLVRAFEHGVRVATALGDPAAPALARAHRAFAASPAGEGFPLMLAVARRTLELARPKDAAEPTARDQVRPEVLRSAEPSGRDVLALDLAAAGLDGLLAHGRAIEGIDDDLLTDLCAAAGRRAAEFVAAFPAGAPSEDAALADAGREAIRHVAPELPSRQRRDIVELWVAGWNYLLAQACRGTCPHRCPEHVAQPRLLAAFSLDHPSFERPWP